MATNALIAPNIDWIAFQNARQATNSKPNGEQWNIGYRNEHGVHGVGEHDDYMLVGGFCTQSQALMMAAAPALLAALEALAPLAHQHMTGGYGYEIDNAFRAIEQAKGKAA